MASLLLKIHIHIYICNTIHMYSGITSGRVLNGEFLCAKILEVNLFAFAYRLFRRDFSPLDGTYCIAYCIAICPVEWGEISTKQSVGKCKQINLFAFAYRLFRRDFSPLDGTYCIAYCIAICPVEWGEISTKQSVGKCKQINF